MPPTENKTNLIVRQQLPALLRKEWIKLRVGIWILPLLLIYAAGESYINLQSMLRIYGTYGLWEVIVFKQPLFFDAYRIVVACGIVIGFLQILPESRNKRLRVLFHTPLRPEILVSHMLITGLLLLILVSLVGYTLLIAILNLFFFPQEIIIPVLLTLLPWNLLGIAAYLLSLSFFFPSNLPTKLLVLAVFFSLSSLLLPAAFYGQFNPSLWHYGSLTAACLFVVFFTSLSFLHKPVHLPLFSLSRTATCILAAIILSAALPHIYWKTFLPPAPIQKMHFSPVLREFVYSTSDRISGKEPAYFKEDNSSLTRKEFQSSLPFLYWRNLEKWGIFPTHIHGTDITPEQARLGWQYLWLSSDHVNSSPPMLHVLFEANPEDARLQKPRDFFRINNNTERIEFLSPLDGNVNEKKSNHFTRALKESGFRFPVTALGGNPDARKEYDAGYFLADSNGSLFRMQMIDSMPSVSNTGSHLNENVIGIVIREHHRKEFYGFIVSENSLYAIEQPHSTLKRLPLDTFHPEAFALAFWSDILHTSLVIRPPGRELKPLHGMALNGDFTIKHEFTKAPDKQYEQAILQRASVASFLFPIQIQKNKTGSSFMNPVAVYAENIPAAMTSIILCLIIYLAFRISRKSPVLISDIIVVSIFGLPALATIIIIDF